MHPAVAIQLAVSQINSGRVDEAEKLLNQVLASRPKEMGALVARGTARALKRDLTGAISDFSAAIEVEPRYADTWKRRGQARSALNLLDEGLLDLQKALDLMPLMGGPESSASSRAEVFLERGMIYQKRRDYRRACKEAKEAVKLDPQSHQAWNVLGLCSTSQGDIRDGVAAYQKALKLKPDLREAWLNMAQALKEEGQTQESEKAFARLFALDTDDNPSIHAMRVISQMRQLKGDHLGSIEILNKAIKYKKEDLMIELLYQRAICYHALGYVKNAIKDYEDCLGFVKSGGNLSEEARSLQFLSFYQKEMALYQYRSLDRNMRDTCLDAELQPLFKELWAKKGPPTAELVAHYTPQPPLPSSLPLPPPRPSIEIRIQLTSTADKIGRLLQNNHQGFHPNVRQQRASGFAALELAQQVRKLLSSKKAGNHEIWIQSQGSTAQAGASGRHQFGWRDAMDIIVKWRQLSEPNDQVIWVDLLTRREFEQGFGSHTPMFTGQTKCVRYYMNFPRALELHKKVLMKEGHAFDAQNRPVPCGSSEQMEAIKAAVTAEDMYQVLGSDSWVVVPIHSQLSQPGHAASVEGTRLTLVRVPNQPDAYEFSIRTPVTPPRWKQFDVELEVAWEAVLGAMLEGDHPKTAKCILTFAYYWYNFMPLARGTAACGYTTILSLFWAVGMPVTASIPKGCQVDWEAILSQHPDDFAAAVGKWLYPNAAIRDATPKESVGTNASRALPSPSPSALSSSPPFLPDVSYYPLVDEVLPSLRHRIEILNGEGMKRI